MTAFLDFTDIVRIIDRLQIGPIRDAGLLASAIERPQTTVLGRAAYPTIYLQAAALLESLARNHALVDGNRRLAWLALVVFTHVNGYEILASDDEAYDYVISVCTGSLNLEDSAALLKEHLLTGI